MASLEDVLRPKPLRSTTDDYLTIHTKGPAKWTYWEKLKTALILVFGGNVYFSNCMTVKAKFSSKNEFLGIDHYASFGQLIVGLGDSKSLMPAETLDPITHMRIVKE